MSAIGASAIQAGSDIFNGLLGSYMNYRNNRENRKNMQWAYNKNLEQWNRENAYNLPSAQISRMKSAGLNPALMYDSGTGMIPAASSPQTDPSAGRSEAYRPNMQIDPLVSANIELAKSQAEKNRAEADAARQNSETQASVGEGQKSYWKKLEDNVDELIKNYSVQRDVDESQVFLNGQMQLYYQHLSDDISNKVRFFKDTYDDMKSKVSNEAKLTAKELDTFDRNLNSIINLRLRQAELYTAQKALTDEQASELKKVNQNWYKIENNKIKMQRAEIGKMTAERQRLLNDIRLANEANDRAKIQMAMDAYFRWQDQNLHMLDALGSIIPF